MELEFSVDPLFKKASADFDEGGAKGLLLNHLAIDSSGRIVFDSSDDAEDATTEAENTKNQNRSSDENEDVKKPEDIEHHTTGQVQEAQIDIGALCSKFFPDLSRLDEQDICPSLKNFDVGDQTGSLDIPFLKAPDDWRPKKENPQPEGLGDRSGMFMDDDNAAGFDDDDGVLAGFDIVADVAFGEGGEAWAKDAAIEPQIRVHSGEYNIGDVGEEKTGEEMGVGGFNPESNQYAVSLHHNKTQGDHDDILSYFDNALKKNWAGPEHWRIRRIKDITKPVGTGPTKRKEKEPFEIDFTSPLDSSLAELIYTPATSNASISLPKTQWKSKTKNLLPDDKHFNSRQLLQLFLKPKARMGSPAYRTSGTNTRNPMRSDEIPEGEMDEAFWARKENIANQSSPDQDDPQGNYDANFFQDDGLAFPGGLPDDDDDFADAREAFSPVLEGEPAIMTQGMDGVLASSEGGQEGAFGTQLVTQSRRLRPEYVQYARVAKKVDVRKLKEEMWRGIGFDKVFEISKFDFGKLMSIQETSAQDTTLADNTPQSNNRVLKFTSIMNDLQQVYPKQAMADISTSYCFICLLHLANEKGLTLSNEIGLEELCIQKDFTAEITEGAD